MGRAYVVSKGEELRDVLIPAATYTFISRASFQETLLNRYASEQAEHLVQSIVAISEWNLRHLSSDCHQTVIAPKKWIKLNELASVGLAQAHPN